jgi:hypothetical protein
MPDTPSPAPTVQEVRDRIAHRLTLEPGFSGKHDYAKQRNLGDGELVIFHPSGKKYSITVRELEE